MNLHEFTRKYGTTGASLILRRVANVAELDEDMRELLLDVAENLQSALEKLTEA
jgi:hypothetical protein